jgi:hypothetical protein
MLFLINFKFTHLFAFNSSIMSHCNASNDGRSSFRINNSGYFHSPYTTTSNAGCSSNQQQHLSHPYHGRLQKSLSFAFQTPQMMNDYYNNYYGCQNQANQFNNYPGERCYSR